MAVGVIKFGNRQILIENALHSLGNIENQLGKVHLGVRGSSIMQSNSKIVFSNNLRCHNYEFSDENENEAILHREFQWKIIQVESSILTASVSITNT